MKRLLTAFALMLTLSASTMQAFPQHRHHAKTTTTVDDQKNKSQEKDAVVAFSDTTSNAANDSVNESQAKVVGYENNFDDQEPVDKFVTGLVGGTLGIGAGIFGLVVCLLVFLFLAAPFIVVIVAIRYSYKKRRDRDRLIQEAIQSGQPLSAEALSNFRQETDEQLWRKGITKICVGVGLALMFLIMGAKQITGVGLLVMFIGIGQAVIAHTNQKKKNNNNDDFNSTIHNESI